MQKVHVEKHCGEGLVEVEVIVAGEYGVQVGTIQACRKGEEVHIVVGYPDELRNDEAERDSYEDQHAKRSEGEMRADGVEHHGEVVGVRRLEVRCLAGEGNTYYRHSDKYCRVRQISSFQSTF